MKKLFVATIVLVLLCFQFAFAQNEINVPANQLNALIDAVSNASAGDIFVLERGGAYFNQGRITNTVPITIKAADGSGAKPLIQQAPNADGGFAGEDIGVEADLTVQNIHFNGIRTSRTNATGRAIRLRAPDVRLVIDGCVFERYWLRTIGFNDQDGCKFYATNNLHLWDGRDDRIDNGRPYDLRAAGVDTFFLQNNTYLNCNDRYVRHMGADLKPIKYAFVDHNTFYGNIGYRPPFQFRTVEELVFTNNIIANAGMLGTPTPLVAGTPATPDTVTNRLNEIDYEEPFAICVFTITGADTLNTQVSMKNNNVYIESRVTDLYALNSDSIEAAPLFNKQWEDRIDPSMAKFEEALTFGNPPSLDSMLLSIQDYVMGGTNWGNGGFITYAQVLTEDEVDMSYGTSAASYTAAAGGFPLGDLNWYPDKKAEWEDADRPTSVKDNTAPEKFSLAQNYPNPFNPETQIPFTLASNLEVELAIYNVIGQKIHTLLKEKRNAGVHSITWNGKNDAGVAMPSGVYFYKLKSGSKEVMRKMLLVK